MPFDGTKATPITTTLRNLFGPRGQHWCRDDLFSTNGRMCLLGAIEKGFQTVDRDAVNLLYECLLPPHGKEWGTDYKRREIMNFNDAAKNFKEIASLLDRAEQRELEKINAV